jgi:ribosomal protein S18
MIPIKITYKDVLILEQYMRLDGTVLPKELTGFFVCIIFFNSLGLCSNQQKRLERCVMQAHWSGLFPNRTIPEFDISGYKRFNRHWDDDTSMFRLKFKIQPGSWFYIKRYNPRASLYKKRKDEVK